MPRHCAISLPGSPALLSTRTCITFPWNWTNRRVTEAAHIACRTPARASGSASPRITRRQREASRRRWPLYGWACVGDRRITLERRRPTPRPGAGSTQRDVQGRPPAFGPWASAEIARPCMASKLPQPSVRGTAALLRLLRSQRRPLFSKGPQPPASREAGYMSRSLHVLFAPSLKNPGGRGFAPSFAKGGPGRICFMPCPCPRLEAPSDGVCTASPPPRSPPAPHRPCSLSKRSCSAPWFPGARAVDAIVPRLILVKARAPGAS